MPKSNSDAARDFAAMVRGDHPDAEQYRRYVLAELRCAVIRARCLQHEITTIGVALDTGVIDPDTAIAWLAAANALDFLVPSEPPWQTDGGGENGSGKSGNE